MNVALLCPIYASAHASLLNVAYDDCAAKIDGDHIDEMWYILGEGDSLKHISHEEFTIKYYFSNASLDGADTWTSNNISVELAQEIKNAYANSMKKWNNVYFYTANSDGTVSKNKIINIVPGTYNDHNLIIYPSFDSNAIASTTSVGVADNITETGGVTHFHYSQWEMTINVDKYYMNGFWPAEMVDHIRERNGAHEIGHILGLRDVEGSCNASLKDWHHHELLMGYGEPITNRMPNITYKDIAGVAITRGFHTDDDHKWLNAGKQDGEQYKLICSICNGVKYVTNLDEYTCDAYGSCNGEHNLPDGKMMAVACYGTKDYYKCKYCRYVAPFENNVEQNYIAGEYIDALQHSCYNNVAGLNYYTYEPHAYQYTYVDTSTHSAICVCGDTITEAHWVKQSELVDDTYGVCSQCGAIIDLRGGIIGVNPFNIAKVSVNGSYLLPNGVAVIADADIEAYLNGTLVFYDPDDLPVTQ